MGLNKKSIVEIIEKTLHQEVIKVSYQKGGWSSTTHHVTTVLGSYFFKENYNNHQLELDLTKKLIKLGVPLPEIVAVGEKWMISKAINGIPINQISDEELILKILPEAGRSTAIINSQMTEGYGPLKTLDSGSFKNYLDFYKELIAKTPKSYRKTLEDYVQNVKSSYLCHGDIGLTHIFADINGRYQALIDIDDALGAAQLYDLAEFDIGNNRNEKIWEAFVSGYSAVIPAPPHESKLLLIEEYLIAYDSYLFFKEKHSDKLDRIKEEERRLDILASLIW